MVVADLPGGEACEEIGDEVEAFLTHDILVGRDAVGVEYLVGLIAELCLQGVLIVGNGGCLTLECLHRMGFERVPACQQRHLSLLTPLEHSIGTL